MNDLISVIIPVKNGHKYLPAALQSIQAQQMNTEIIVVDDASTDDTIAIAEKFTPHIIRHQTSLGPVIAKNNALKIATGKYIMFHDHDDIMLENTLKKLKTELDNNPDTDMVMAKVKDFLSEDITNKNVHYKQDAYWGLFTGATLIRKSVFDTVGLFDETIRSGEIMDLQNKMNLANLKIKKLDFIASMRRIHDTNFGRTSQQKEFTDYATILRRRLKK